ncbi:MAG: ABC transporter permease [Clostridia bacterium]|nr:ABC transporter permease [Clostridia bacterium]
MEKSMNIAVKENSMSNKVQRVFEPRWTERIGITLSNPGTLLVLPVIFIAVFLGYPLLNIFIQSIYNGHLTSEYYVRFFSEGLYIRVLLLTLKIGAIVTLTCLVLGYPVAYTMTFASKRAKGLILIAILIPFWTSLLVRTYAWMVLLQTQGVVNQMLLKLGIIHEPIKMIYNTTGVVIGMTHVLLPYMILCLYSVMQGIDKNLLSAGSNLGARPFQVFSRVFLPLSFPGIMSGSMLVFIMGIGYFITPSLLGGQKDSMISQLIQIQVGDLLNWGFASAISFVLLAVTLLLLMLSRRFLRLDKLW